MAKLLLEVLLGLKVFCKRGRRPCGIALELAHNILLGKRVCQQVIEYLAQGEKEGEGEGGKKGEPKSQGEGEGGDSEGDAGELLEIYKEQQRLREALQQLLEKEGMGGNGQNAMRQMQQIEKQLLSKGFKGDAVQKMQNLKHELLKLDKAMRQQGEENKRQSQTNKKDYNSSDSAIPPALKEYLNSVEILNRQSLPLRPNFNQRVQTYFKQDD